jgi:hypothetical protein
MGGGNSHLGRKKGLSLFGVCLFFGCFLRFGKSGLPSKKKLFGGKTWAGPPIIIKRTCNSVQFADDFQARMIDRGAICRDMHNKDHTKVEVIHGIGRYHSLFIWIFYIFKLHNRKLSKKETIMHKDYVFRIMTRAGISVVGNAFDQLFILHKKRDVPLTASIASIAPSIPVFGAIPSSLTQTRTPPSSMV